MTTFSLAPFSQVNFTIRRDITTIDSPIHRSDSHIHKEYEIYVVLSGDVSFEVENKIFSVSRGSVIITKPYEYHRCIYHSKKPHDHYWITFSTDGEDEYLKMFSNREKGYGNLINLNEEQLAELCVILETLLKKDTLAITQQINYLRIFDLFQTVGYVKTQNTTTNVSQIVLTAIKYMDMHLTENITAKQLSAVCNVSVNTLERHFKSELGISPLAMLRKKRLIESIEYLHNGDTVSQAAIKCGFPDYSNYIQSFRSLFNMTPLQYKKNIKKKQTS